MPPAVVMEMERVPVMPACQSRSVLLESEGAMLYHDRDHPYAQNQSFVNTCQIERMKTAWFHFLNLPSL